MSIAGNAGPNKKFNQKLVLTPPGGPSPSGPDPLEDITRWRGEPRSRPRIWMGLLVCFVIVFVGTGGYLAYDHFSHTAVTPDQQTTLSEPSLAAPAAAAALAAPESVKNAQVLVTGAFLGQNVSFPGLRTAAGNVLFHPGDSYLVQKFQIEGAGSEPVEHEYNPYLGLGIISAAGQQGGLAISRALHAPQNIRSVLVFEPAAAVLYDPASAQTLLKQRPECWGAALDGKNALIGIVITPPSGGSAPEFIPFNEIASA